MKFIESVHKYIDEEQEFTPVTNLLHKFQEYVDWDAECRKKAKKLGVTFESLKKQWDDKRNRAASRGTAFHKMKEEQYIKEGKMLLEDVECPVKHYVTHNNVKEDTSMKLENNHIYSEKMIWSRKYRVCGTADLVEVVGNKIHIKDYKTNEKLETESYKHPVTGPKRLLFPLNSLDDCNFNLYQLQLNLYMFMLLQQNRHLKMGNMTILHVQFNDKGELSTMFPYKVKDMQKEVRAMLEHFKSRK